MRVEPCGGLFVEPKEGDTFFQPHRLSEPISIINPKSNLLLEKERRFSELNLVGNTSYVGQKNLNLSSENKEYPLPIGFFLTEEEWSLIKQPHLGLEPYEQKKMGSLPKSFTPFTFTDGLERHPNGPVVTDSILLRKCESLSATPSLSFVNENEPNNNTISHLTSLAKFVSQKPQDAFQEEEEKENWVKPGEVQPFVKLNNLVNNNSSSSNETCHHMVNQTYVTTAAIENQNNNTVVRDFKSENLASGFLGFPPSQMNSSVGTIGSHPQPITSSSRDQCHTPSHIHYQPNKLVAKIQNSSGPVSSSSFGQQDLDWQSQSLLWTTNNDIEQATNWNQNFVTAENFSEVSSRQESHFPYIQPVSGRPDEMETLLTFLAKFDDKVAAIWGVNEEGAAAIAANLQYTDGYLSNSSTPVGGTMYPWGSPTSEQPPGQGFYDLRAMQIQIEQQQRMLAESQRVAEQFYQKQYCEHHINYPQELQSTQQFKPNPSNRIAIGTSTIIPPKGKYTIMHSMKQHFGTAPSEYHIVRKADVGTSIEEKEKSLCLLNHHEENSGFKRFLPEIHCKQKKLEVATAAKDKCQELDIKYMQDILNSLDLEYEEELEIVAACKGDPKPFIEPPPQEDLLNSWKTHFTTIDYIETSDMCGQIVSPITTLSAHQINPNLPEFRLFEGNEQDYSVFQHPGKTMFPVRYKLRPDNEKSVQTEDIVEEQPTYELVQDQLHHLSVFDWENFLPGSPYPFSFPSVSRSSLGPRTYDYDNSLETQTSDWFSDNTGVGSGSLAEFDYNSGGFNDGSSNTFVQADYCCDSGIGIDGSSRTGFYDDVFPDYEGDYEYVGGGHDDAGIHAGFTATNENVDYDHFQVSSYNTWSNSTVPWKKQGKGSRRRAKVKPCKYFLLDGSCRRGRDCKFSHDLTTCRYWAEGSCLKGDSCPYLHCFLERNDFVGQGEYKHGKRYHLESENDFPALSSTKANAMLSSRVPMSLGFPSEEDRDVKSSTESLLMLADPAGSVCDVSGFGSSFNTVGGGFLSGHNKTMDSNGWIHQNEETKGPPETKRNCNSTRTIGKSSDSGSSTPRIRHGINKGNGHNSSWICSMISVKERRKKKKY